jgi:uncharacterized protein (DUF1501 family)
MPGHRRPLLTSRRGLLRGASAALALPALVRRASAASETGAEKKFIFVVNYGGWDPTRVLAPEFDNPNVDMERDAESATCGDVTFTDHEDRPSVRSFFESYHDRTVIVKGILVPSVAHENCLRLSMTGTTRQDASDWSAILGGAQGPDFSLPCVVAAGPSFPGEFGAYVTRTGTSGQLPALLDGGILDWSDVATKRPDRAAEDIMDRYLLRRAEGATLSAGSAREAELTAAFQTAVERSTSLKGLVNVVDWSASSAFSEQIGFAVDVLSLGVSRSVTLSFSYYSWDTHASNDLYQSYNWEMLFSGLGDLMARLRATAGTNGGTLADETVVVVLSEMGRTPQLNSLDGKDHWPYSSLMVVGGGVGDRVIGGYDAYYYGEYVDLASGEISESGQALVCDVVGATLLQLGGIDSEEFLPGVGHLADALRG